MFYCLLVLLIFLIIFIHIYKIKGGSDQVLHKLIIDTIKKNNHKFVTKIPTFLFAQEWGYPQLFHWFLAYLNESIINKLSRYLPFIILLSSLILHVIFTINIYIYLEATLSLNDLLFYSSVIFLTNGLLFNQNNARSIGISPRGLGLLLGQIYIYMLIFYYFSNSYIYLICTIFIILLIILASQFAAQFVLLSIPIFSLMTYEIYFLFLPVIAFLIFMILFPKFSKLYFTFQWKYRKWYFLIGSKTYILQYRDSIWLDFINGFWRKFKKNGFKKTIGYIFYNPLIIVLTGVPLLVPILYYFFYERYLFTSTLYPLFLVSITGFIIFILITFKITRFLGEPERYIDFILSPLSILTAVILVNNHNLIIMLLIVAIFRILGEIIIKNQNHKSVQYGFIIKKIYQINSKRKVRLFCNNLNVTKSMLSTKIKAYWGSAQHDSIDEYKKVFQHYPIVNEHQILPIISKYKINVVIIDKKYLQQPYLRYFPSNSWSRHFENKLYVILEKSIDNIRSKL